MPKVGATECFTANYKWGCGMSGRRTSVAVRFSLVLVTAITLLLLGAAFGLAQYLSNKLEEKSLDALQSTNRMIINMIGGYDNVVQDAVQRLAAVFAGNYPEPFHVHSGTGLLMHGDFPISFEDASIPDHFTRLSGAAATVLTRRGDDFERTSTSVKDEHGNRAAGVLLGADHPAIPFLLAGQPYTGMAKMLGRDVMTHYTPIADSSGETIGAFFVGIDATDTLAGLKAKVAEVRIGETGYPYALDAGRDKGRLVLHPQLEGESLLGQKDAHGREFIADMLASGNGVINYWWKNPGEQEAREKIVAYDFYPPWSWIVASGSYLSEFNSEGKEVGRGLMQMTLLLIPVVLALVWVATRRWVTKPLNEAVAVANKVAEGDFTMRIEAKSNDEIGALVRAQSTMVEQLGKTIRDVRGAASSVAADAGQLANAAEHVASSSTMQSNAAADMAVSVEQMSASIDMIAQHAAEALTVSTESETESRSSALVIERAVAAMNDIAETVRRSSGAIEQLGRESQEISAIVNTIKDIADQTNLLALNAAIEAARAGEQGRGFAVVADEVRKLAERTSTSTHEISEMIARIQENTQNAVGNMNLGVDQVSSGVELAAEATAAIERIHDGAVRVSQAVSGINTAISEQSIATTSVAQGLEKIAHMTERNNVEAQETAQSAEGLQSIASRLQAAVQVFKV